MTHSESPTILLLVRAQNDWEHSFPVAYALSQKVGKVLVIFVDHPYSFPISDVPKNILTRTVGEYGVSNKLKFKIQKILTGVFFFRWKFLRRLPHRFTCELRVQSLAQIVREVDSDKRIILCHDYTTSDLAMLETREFLKKNLRISKTVTLPHSISNWKNKWTSRSVYQPSKNVPETLPESDIYIATDRFQAEELHAPREKIKVLGSARYSSEWLEKLDRGNKNADPAPSSQKTVLLLLSKEQMNYNISEVQRMVKMIKAIPNVRLVIKPHTRGGSLDGLPENFQEFCSFEPTRNLFLSADLVLFTATSAIVEAIHYRKPTLFLRKTTTNQIHFESYFKNWAIDTCEQLYNFLIRFINNEHMATYTENEREIFLGEFGASNPKTLEIYTNEILN